MLKKYQATDLLGDILDLVEQRWVSAEAILNIVNKSGEKELDKRIAFLQELKKLIREIPVEVFNDNEQRQNMMESTQNALDTLIDQEEEQLSG